MATKAVTAAQQDEADRKMGQIIREQIGHERAQAAAERKARAAEAAAEKRHKRLALTLQNEDGSMSTQDNLLSEIGTLASELLDMAEERGGSCSPVVVGCIARRIGYLTEKAGEAAGERIDIRHWNAPMYSTNED